jgi:hypothetical protein
LIEAAFLAALCRLPTEAERERITKTLTGSTAGTRDPKRSAAARRLAVEDLYWAILTCDEFLFNH